MTKRNGAKLDWDDEEAPAGDSKTIWRRERTIIDWEVYISGPLNNPRDHLERIDLIRAAGEEDTIRIHLNTGGGRVSIMESYLDAISESKAKIITRAVSLVASAGTDIWLAGDEREISNRATFMFHNTQLWTDGDVYNVSKYTDYMERLFRDQLTETYGEVLSEDELKTIFTGGEVWIRGTDMKRRIEGVPDQPLIEIDNEQHKRAKVLNITLPGGFFKEIALSTLSSGDFCEFSVPEVKGILTDIGVPSERFLGERNWKKLTDIAVEELKKSFGDGDQ